MARILQAGPLDRCAENFRRLVAMGAFSPEDAREAEAWLRARQAPRCCVLCGRREWLLTSRCETTGDPVVTCADAAGCLDRFHGAEGRAFQAARLFASARK